MAGEIGTLFVRIRPQIAGFSTEVKGQVNSALRSITSEISKATTANNAAASETVASNKRVAASYAGIATAATTGVRAASTAVKTSLAEQRTAAAETAGSAEKTASVVRLSLAEQRAEASRTAATAVKAAAETVQSQRLLIDALHQAGRAAKAGSDESILAFQAEREAAAKLNAELGIVAKTGGGVFEGLKRHVLNLGTAFGVGFGADLSIRFVNSLVGAAASTQKSTEVVRAQFGKTSKSIIDFANTAGIQLGIAGEDSLSTAARFGLLFKSVGISGPITGRMTLGFLRLAGALSSIRGTKAADALGAITSAASGNLRGLRSLGIVLDANQLKLEAQRLGLIKAGQALTPAARAEAVYALATAHLSQLLQEAKSHSGDYADTQARLSAEWKHSKEIIGTALLPVFDRLAGRLADWLDKANRSGRLQKDVNRLMRDFGGVLSGARTVLGPLVSLVGHLSGALGGAKNTAIAFLAAFGVSKLAEVGGSIKLRIGKALSGITPAAQAASRNSREQLAAIGTSAGETAKTIDSTVLRAFADIGGAAKAAAVEANTALASIRTQASGLVPAFGGGVSTRGAKGRFVRQPVPTGVPLFGGGTATRGANGRFVKAPIVPPAISADFKKIGVAAGQADAASERSFGRIRGSLGQLGTKFGSVQKQAATSFRKMGLLAPPLESSVKTVGPSIATIGTSAVVAEDVSVSAFAGIGVAARGLSLAIKSALISTGIGALAVAIGIGISELIQHWSAVQKFLRAFYGWLDRQKAWQRVVEVVLESVAKIRHAVSAFVPYVESFWRHWGGTIVAITKTFLSAVKASFEHIFGVITGTIDVFKGIFTGKWSLIWTGIKKITSNALKELVAPFKFFAKVVELVFKGLWKNVELAMLEGADFVLKLVSKVVGQVTGALSVFTSFFGLGKVKNPLAGIGDTLDALIRKIKQANALAKQLRADAAAAAATAKARARREAAGESSGFPGLSPKARAAAAGLQTSLSGILDPARAKFQAYLAELAKFAKLNAANAAADAIFNNSVRNAIHDAKQQLADAIASGNEKITAARQSFIAYMHSGNEAVVQKIKSDNREIIAAERAFREFVTSGNEAVVAKQRADNVTIANLAKAAAVNVVTIGKKITAAIGDIVAKHQKAGFTGSDAEFAKLKALIASGKNTQKVFQEANRLSSEIQARQANGGAALAALKQKLENRATAIVEGAQKGKIGPKLALSELNALVRQAGGAKALGKQGQDELTANIKGLAKQLQKIAEETASVRDAARKATQGGLGPKIIDVAAEIKRLRTQEDAAAKKYGQGLIDKLQRLHSLQQRLHTEDTNAANRYAAGLRQHLAKLSSAQVTAAKAVGRAEEHLARTEHTQQLRVAAYSLAEQKKHTAILKAIQKQATKSANLQASLNGIQDNSAFRKAVKQNPGIVGAAAAAAAKKGLVG